eukprot:scaffold9106_cov118-Isochrysis_galbana.AAC.5
MESASERLLRKSRKARRRTATSHAPPNNAPERGMGGKAPTRYSTSSIMTMWFLFPALLCLPCLATFCACEVCSFP